MRYHWTHIMDGYYIKKKSQVVTSAGEHVQKLQLLCTVGGNVTWCNCCRKQYSGAAQNAE